MVMSFVDGATVNEIKTVPQANPEHLIAALADHYAVQFAVDGLFNADPHAGNIMVERHSGRLIVLDWGMAITLPEHVSKAYAKLFFAVATTDVWALIETLETIGLEFKDGDTFEPMMFLTIFRVILRDSQPLSMAREQTLEGMKVGRQLDEKGPKRYQK